MPFRTGQPVCCVNDRAVPWAVDPDLSGDAQYYGLKRGSVYIIEAIEDGFLALIGIKGTWNASRFRPLVERKTSIEIFQKMLNPSLEELRAIIREEV